MSDEADRAAILARRKRFIAMALAGLGGCAAEPKPGVPNEGVAVLPVASMAVTTKSAGPEQSLDSDNDGVLDADDQCPKIPAGDRPWAEHPGCPKPLACLTINPYATLQILAKIRFDRFSHKLHPRSAQGLDEIAKLLADSPKLDLDVLGHCEKGEPKAIAKQRAEAVRDALVFRGVDSARLRALGGDCEAPSEDSRIVELPNLHERETK